MANPTEALEDLRQDAQERRPVAVAQIDLGKPIAPCRDMIERAVELDPQGPCHGARINPANSRFKT